MSAPAVQQDFGGFNPRFPGVTIRLASMEAVNLFAQSTTGRANNVPHDSLNQIAIASVLDHEVRHYHDSLVSPYSNAVFRLRFAAVLNGMQAFSGIARIDADVLPVPLVSWLFMDDAIRRRQCAEWAEALGQKTLRPLPFPVHDRATFLRPRTPGFQRLERRDHLPVTEAACLAYLRIGHLVDGSRIPEPLPELQPCNVYEAIALCTQLHSIWIMQGEAQTATFLDYLNCSEIPYARLWRRVFIVASHCTPVLAGYEEGVLRALAVTRQMMAMCVWSILGTHDESDAATACPAGRLYRLICHLIDSKSFDRIRDFAIDINATWQRWDKVVAQGATWRDSLTKLRAQGDRMTDTASKATKVLVESTSASTVADLLMSVVCRHTQDQHQAIDYLMNDPESFVNPAAYVQQPTETLPHPIVRIELIDNTAVAVDDLEGTTYIPTNVFQYDGRPCTSQLILRQDVVDFEERRTVAERFEHFSMLCDVAFSTLSVPIQVHGPMVSAMHDLTGKRPMFIV